jgi:hypothetical protein
MKFKIGDTVIISGSCRYGKIVGFSKDKNFYKIQWACQSNPANSMIRISNQNLKLKDW